MVSHAQLPTPLALGDGRFRVFFASRDSQNRSHVGWFELDLNRPDCILGQSSYPILEPGPPGCFDGDGIYPSSVVRHGKQLRMYTVGWNAGRQPPMFYAAVGLAVSDDGGQSFRRYSRVPIMCRSEYDPCFVTSPVVMRDDQGWRMWYVSGYRWEQSARGLWSRYHIKHAESRDGIAWHRAGHICIKESQPDEMNIARCWVIKDRERYHAWFSTSCGGPYRLGYARSKDGLEWHREDDALIFESSGQAWDKTTQCYPAVVPHGGRWYMFYNGAEYGRDGVGLAVAEGP